MKTYLALYMASPAMLEKWAANPPENEDLGGWKQWQDNHSKDIVDLGAPLGKNLHIDSSGQKAEPNQVCGYSLVKANSAEKAAEIFADNPFLEEKETWIDLLECMPMPE